MVTLVSLQYVILPEHYHVLKPTEPVLQPPTEPVLQPPTEPVLQPPTEPVLQPPTEPVLQPRTDDRTLDGRMSAKHFLNMFIIMTLDQFIIDYWPRQQARLQHYAPASMFSLSSSGMPTYIMRLTASETSRCRLVEPMVGCWADPYALYNLGPRSGLTKKSGSRDARL